MTVRGGGAARGFVAAGGSVASVSFVLSRIIGVEKVTAS